MLYLQKFILVSIIGLAHAAILFSSPLESRSGSGLDSSRVLITIFAPPQSRPQRYMESPSPKEDAYLVPAIPISMSRPIFDLSPQIAQKTNERLDFSKENDNTSEYQPQLLPMVELPDETILPPDNIAETLQTVLPFSFGLLILDFLVDSAGNTITVECVGGDCNPAVVGSLKTLPPINFRPAFNEGVPIVSWKTIQIEATNTF